MRATFRARALARVVGLILAELRDSPVQFAKGFVLCFPRALSRSSGGTHQLNLALQAAAGQAEDQESVDSNDQP